MSRLLSGPPEIPYFSSLHLGGGGSFGNGDCYTGGGGDCGVGGDSDGGGHGDFFL